MSYLLSIFFYVSLALILLFFHVLLLLLLKLNCGNLYQVIVNYLNITILRCLHILGGRFSIENKNNIPIYNNNSLIIVSNHQSMFDIPLIAWAFKKNFPKFVSKIELGKGIPSVSLNLRHGGNVLIDRENPRKSISQLNNFGKDINKKNYSAVIFPEGTRSTSGVPKSFKKAGLKILLKNLNSHDSLIVPVSINNSWKIVKNGFYPLGIRFRIILTIHKPLNIKNSNIESLINDVEEKIISSINK